MQKLTADQKMAANNSIIGYYQSNNTGDEAFTLAFDILLPRGQSASYHSIRHSDIKSVEILAKDAKVVFGGGAIIAEPYFWESIPQDLHYSLASCDIGGSDELLSKYRDSFQRIEKGWIRSQQDLHRLSRYTDNPRLLYAPDAVFALGEREYSKLSSSEKASQIWNYLSESNSLLREDKYKPEYKNLAVFCSDHYLDYPRISASNIHEASLYESKHLLFEYEVSRALEELLPYYNIYMIGMSHWHNAMDSHAAHRIKRLMPSGYKVGLTTLPVDPELLIKNIKCFDLAISMKFHGLVIPIASGVPVINIGSSSKNLNLVEELSLLSSPHPGTTSRNVLQLVKESETEEYKAHIFKASLKCNELVQEMTEKFFA